ncbi:MAG: VCBS repeat-containing protein, partial [Nitrospinota bacterium]|nr:VCBS repeat-containing protein [Nitrospinota bacterium]
ALSGASGWNIAAVGDLNGNGKADIVWRNYKTGANAVWFMNGATLSSGAPITPLSLASGWDIVGAGDTDADGKADLILRKASTNQIAVWLMNGETLLSGVMLRNLSSAWTVDGMSDLDGDGNADILLRNYSNGVNVVWFMSGGNMVGGATFNTLNNASWHMGNN